MFCLVKILNFPKIIVEFHILLVNKKTLVKGFCVKIKTIHFPVQELLYWIIKNLMVQELLRDILQIALGIIYLSLLKRENL